MKGKSSKKISKKAARDLVYAKLAAALDEYKGLVKEKRFTANLKKASKLFADDIAKAANKGPGKPAKKGKSKTEQVKDQPPAA